MRALIHVIIIIIIITLFLRTYQYGLIELAHKLHILITTNNVKLNYTINEKTNNGKYAL